MANTGSMHQEIRDHQVQWIRISLNDNGLRGLGESRLPRLAADSLATPANARTTTATKSIGSRRSRILRDSSWKT